MTLYFLWLKDNGVGCDYTVGCGEKLIPLKADNLADVAVEVREEISNHGAKHLEKALLLTPNMDMTCEIEAQKAEIEEESFNEAVRDAQRALDKAKADLDLVKLEGKLVQDRIEHVRKIVLPGMLSGKK